MNKFKKVKVLDTTYTYPLGVIRSREVKLLTGKDYEELISSRDENELLTALHDTLYGKFLRNMDAGEFEEGLRNARVSLYNEMEKFIDHPELMEKIRADFDFLNITILLKGSIAEEDYTEYCSPLGTIPVERLNPIFKEEKYEKLPEHLHRAVQEGIEAYYSSDHNPQMLNFAIDRVMTEFITLEVDNDFLQEYYKIKVDCTNMKTILRLFFLERYEELIEKAILPGGKIRREEIISQNFENPDSIVDFYHRTIYEPLIQWKDSFAVLDREIEKFLLSFLRSVAFESIGVEPIIAYLFKRDNEIRNIRLIFIGKINGVQEDVIKERLVV